MKEIIYVSTGEVKTGRRDEILKSSGIGSCVVITAHHPGKKVGVMAHVMLPGTAPGGKDIQRTRYAADAIDEIIERMRHSRVSQDNIEVCLVGGGNVLGREEDEDAVGTIITASVIEIINEKHIDIKRNHWEAERGGVSLWMLMRELCVILWGMGGNTDLHR